MKGNAGFAPCFGGRAASTAGGTISYATYPIPEECCYLFLSFPLNRAIFSVLSKEISWPEVLQTSLMLHLYQLFCFVLHPHSLLFTMSYKSTLKQPLSSSCTLQLSCSTFINF